MESLKGTDSLIMIILSLLSKFIDIPNHLYSEIVGESSKKKDENFSDHSSLIRRNVLTDITSAAKSLFQNNNDASTGDSEKLFGKPLPRHLPTKLKKLLIFIRQMVYHEGIFRKCGSNKRMKELRQLLDTHGNMIDWSDQEVFNVHDAASVLKQYIAELPQPLLTARHLPLHHEIAKLSDVDKRLKCIRLLFLLLPEENRIFLKMLLVVLSEAAAHEGNLMDSHNLGLIFAPHLLKSSHALAGGGALCIGGGSLADGIEDGAAYTEFIINNSDTVFHVPKEVEVAAERYQCRLARGESTDDIPVEIESNCQKISTNLHKRVVTNETKTQLINLYKAVQAMPDSKDKKDRLKKFEKQYPHYIMELNNISHSPIIRTKSTRKNIGNSLSRLISGSRCSSLGSLSHLHQSTPCKAPEITPCKGQENTTFKGPETTPSGSKRKALEMLNNMSPTPQPGSSEMQQEEEDTGEQPARSVRRKLDDENLKVNLAENLPEDMPEEMMDYRDLGESYREYFI